MKKLLLSFLAVVIVTSSYSQSATEVKTLQLNYLSNLRNIPASVTKDNKGLLFWEEEENHNEVASAIHILDVDFNDVKTIPLLNSESLTTSYKF